ncbi:TetR/AcrR family transcriptional regulator [Nocardiopsis alkaliphila]|uniref:TetR/AcrR family transcriptional regulator n=1 Tax=Nocardiopsis alkaliphila TaxID=225762 RepID=UPI00034D91BF|nr:TetR/AcrR family transcriptional regulator [Nocardiopsis alkaliphila]
MDSMGEQGAGQVKGETRAVVLAAVRLFTEAGYEATTMAEIAEATGMSRRSLFRRFRSKEDILFAEHDELFETVVRYMEASPETPVDTVVSAARLVFQGYVGAPEITVPRYRLVRAHPRLRDREVAMTARYQAAFSRHLARRTGEGRPSLEVEVVAAAVIAAHNHVLRGWLRDPAEGAVWERFGETMDRVHALAGSLLEGAEAGNEGAERVLVAVYPSGVERTELLRRVADAVAPPS